MESKHRTVFVISDGTGETAMGMVRAALVQYSTSDVQIIRCKNVRTEAQVESVIEDVSQKNGIVVFTVVSPSLREKIQSFAKLKQVLSVDLLGPLLTGFNSFFGTGQNAPEAGKLRVVNEVYFRRVEAIEYTVKHDDGKETRDLEIADIVLVGISRTSKTPLSIFLSHKGLKVANIPLVLNMPPPEELFSIDQRKVVGLTIDPLKLSRIRAKRAEKLGGSGDYANMHYIYEELEYAHKLFEKNKRWPVFDVTERALEETAAEITRIVAARMGISEDQFV
jgi:regulator of PEP synthase PpsR (kinase-PPPase family)